MAMGSLPIAKEGGNINSNIIAADLVFGPPWPKQTVVTSPRVRVVATPTLNYISDNLSDNSARSGSWPFLMLPTPPKYPY